MWAYPARWMVRSGALIAALTLGPTLSCSDFSTTPGQPSTAERNDFVDVRAVPLERIRPGTVIGDTAPTGWTHLIFKTRSRLASGDLDALPSWSAELSSFLCTVLVAKASRAASPAGAGYRLESLAIGLGTRIGQDDVIISSDTQQGLGANLGPIKRIILSQAEDRLNQVLRVARTDTLIVFDAPQTMLTEGRHQLVVFRYAVLVNPSDGRLATLVWRLDRGRDGQDRLHPEPAVLMKPNLVTLCDLHVDKREFTAGIPTSRAFATMRLPLGDPFPMPQAIRAAAAKKQLTEAMVRSLEAALRQAVFLTQHAIKENPQQ